MGNELFYRDGPDGQPQDRRIWDDLLGDDHLPEELDYGLDETDLDESESDTDKE